MFLATRILRRYERKIAQAIIEDCTAETEQLMDVRAKYPHNAAIQLGFDRMQSDIDAKRIDARMSLAA